MDKLRAMETFVRIIDRGSLTAAAATLNTSPPTVVRTLASLEQALGVRLLNRTTRRIALTDEGREYYQRCKRVLEDVGDAEAVLSARRAMPRGRLIVTASVLFGRMHVAPAVIDCLVKHPALQMELRLLDRVVDLVEEGIDAGVRIGRLPDSSLVAIAVGQTRRVVCASPAYLKRAGTPKSPAELASHQNVNFLGVAPGNEWVLADGGGTTRTPIAPAFASNQIDAVLDACLRGVGLGQFLCYQVQPLLDRGKLRRVLSAHEPPPIPIQIVYPSTRLLSSNVRAFVDWIVPRLRALKLGGELKPSRKLDNSL
jgi:DNA-binding transcriptional LysR family regulator